LAERQLRRHRKNEQRKYNSALAGKKKIPVHVGTSLIGFLHYAGDFIFM
jgi:hypothetical protein